MDNCKEEIDLGHYWDFRVKGGENVDTFIDESVVEKSSNIFA